MNPPEPSNPIVGRLVAAINNADRLLARYRNDTWGEMSTFWRFQVSGDKITRIDTGQA